MMRSVPDVKIQILGTDGEELWSKSLPRQWTEEEALALATAVESLISSCPSQRYTDKEVTFGRGLPATLSDQQRTIDKLWARLVESRPIVDNGPDDFHGQPNPPGLTFPCK